jgi:hypothetical protein
MFIVQKSLASINSHLQPRVRVRFFNPQNDETIMDVMSEKLQNSLRQIKKFSFETKPLNRTIEYFEILQ